MKTVLASVVLFVAGALAQFTINTPGNVVQCEPTLISWSGGTGPYFLSILPGASPTGSALENLGQQNSTSVTWTCNFPSGSSLGLTLRDSTGAVAQSAPFTVNPGTSSSCLNSTSIVPGPTSTPSSGSTTGASSPTTTSPSNSASKASSSTSSGAASTATHSSAAMVNAASFGVAGAIGAAVAALFL
ncbi:hypothetical protein SCLCIDRAFT_9019 [Scleroderma citrinum Foug A]|uniref:Uncharacterized protein n=1 Tax=Scleroderma citrinum Foug A TaxID=1036808 RepID=A0A0C3ACP8_9AGAM|nr:hypothetical protein SCLCIDRAFT_9019 [Scleroderma citrinum Foug A]